MEYLVMFLIGFVLGASRERVLNNKENKDENT